MSDSNSNGDKNNAASTATATALTQLARHSLSRQVHPHVHFVADAHAYMMEKNEVIGWLGGWFDEESKVLYVQVSAHDVGRVSASLTDGLEVIATDTVF